MTSRRALAMAALLVVVACSPRSARDVGDKFMDLYFLEFDQERLLPLTSGLAREKIETEIRLVRNVRSDMGRSASHARSQMHYERVLEEVSGNDARLTYRVAIKDARDRLVSLAVHRTGGIWRVGNFTIAEAEPLKAP